MSPDRNEEGPGSDSEANPNQNNIHLAADTEILAEVADRFTTSRQVSWWSVHEYVVKTLDRVGAWPMAGTPAWCALDDTDPAKIAALFDAAQHWALRVETCQEDRCEASRDVSVAADWPAIAVEAYNLDTFHAERPWLKRVTA